MRSQRFLLVTAFLALAVRGISTQEVEIAWSSSALGTDVAPVVPAATDGGGVTAETANTVPTTSDQDLQQTTTGGTEQPQETEANSEVLLPEQPQETSVPSQILSPEQATPTTDDGQLSPEELARCGGPCPTKRPLPIPPRPPCPGKCPPPPKPTSCDVCPSPTYTYTPPPTPPRPTCDSDCPLTTTIPPPPLPTQTCPPRPDCKSKQYKRFYEIGYNSGSGLVRVLLQGHDDCANVDSTVRILQDKAPSSPITVDNSPSLYCRKLGVYTGFLDAVDVFENRCTVRCRDDGRQIGAEAAYLLCNLPTARLARIDLCEISYDAGCALAFEDTIRTYCPAELNSERYNAVKSQVCAFKGQ